MRGAPVATVHTRGRCGGGVEAGQCDMILPVGETNIGSDDNPCGGPPPTRMRPSGASSGVADVGVLPRPDCTPQARLTLPTIGCPMTASSVLSIARMARMSDALGVPIVVALSASCR